MPTCSESVEGRDKLVVVPIPSKPRIARLGCSIRSSPLAFQLPVNQRQPLPRRMDNGTLRIFRHSYKPRSRIMEIQSILPRRQVVHQSNAMADRRAPSIENAAVQCPPPTQADVRRILSLWQELGLHGWTTLSQSWTLDPAPCCQEGFTRFVARMGSISKDSERATATVLTIKKCIPTKDGMEIRMSST